MKIIIPIIAILFLSNSGKCQEFVADRGYESLSLTEFIWSKSKEEFVEIERISEISMFIFNSKAVWFKKHNQDWAGNEWRSRENNTTDLIYGEYIDMLNQKVLVYPEKKQVWYYWGNDSQNENYSNLTIYENFERNDQVIDKLIDWQRKGGHSVPNEIKQAFGRGDFQSVIKLASSITNKDNLSDDENALLFHLMGMSFFQLSDFGNAKNNFEKANSVWGDEATIGETYLYMGYSCLQLEEFELAITYLTKSIERGTTEAYPIRGAANSKNQSYKAGIKDFEIAEKLGLMKDRSDFYYHYGFCYMELGSILFNRRQFDNSKVEYKNAIERFNKATEINPESWAAYKMKGKCYELSGEYEKAIKSYEMALRINSYQPEIKNYIIQLNKLIEEENSNFINVRKENGVYKIPAFLNNVVNVEFIFDSGAGEVLISPEVAMVLLGSKTITESDKLEDGYFVIADGSILRLSRFNVKQIQIGSKRIYNVKCAVSNEIGGDMLLGQSLLEKLGKYTFDYEKKKLIFK